VKTKKKVKVQLVGMFFLLFHFQSSIQSTETELTARQIPISFIPNGTTEKKWAIGLLYKIKASKKTVSVFIKSMMLFLLCSEAHTE